MKPNGTRPDVDSSSPAKMQSGTKLNMMLDMTRRLFEMTLIEKVGRRACFRVAPLVAATILCGFSCDQDPGSVVAGGECDSDRIGCISSEKSYRCHNGVWQLGDCTTDVSEDRCVYHGTCEDGYCHYRSARGGCSYEWTTLPFYPDWQ